ncbi:uncharacterized protein FIBRA_02552 [Fibroporia radiculosa]|uniref:AMP-dependent synthetase/ligase domain-containing protein n=1 Tax=Fibroporia radiculosa TaxID=599839 RepID=J4G1U5_9APHY|nr:uncharacterized protein FIBRA_02552 [Fibroporia radiculosa]CCM00518.1 predicted protein [Fibroporia radiculosa]
MKSFRPTKESFPPNDVLYRLQVPQGIPVYKHPLNPLAFLLKAAQIYPDKLAIAHPDRSHPVFYSYAVWTQRVQNLAYALIQAGISPGDRVAVLAPNSFLHSWFSFDGMLKILTPDAHHGVLAARAVICPINTRLTSQEVAYIIEHSEAKLILVDRELVHLVQNAQIPIIVSEDSGRAGDPYEDFLTNGRKFSREKGWAGLAWESNEDAPAALCYTSGTTGRPKGVVTTLRGTYLAAIANAYETRYHNTYGPFTRCYEQSSWEGLSLDKRARQLARQGISFATSDDARVVYRSEADDPTDVHSCLVDVPKDGKTIGEIVIRGNIVMREYFKDFEATQKAFRGGYFWTGDLAVVYPDGYIAVCDRSKDIIISGGENASSLAIEQELATHPDVLEVSVVARPHARWGERPMAFVTLQPQGAPKWSGRHDAFVDDLKKHARTRLPGFACPEWVEIVDELPVRIPVLLIITVAVDAVLLLENINGKDTKSRAAQNRR